MGYYDIYDSYDRCIGHDVWLDDGSDSGGGRPVIINWYKIMIIIGLACGIANTFVMPILLFLNRSVFIPYGWLVMAITNWLAGIPALIISIHMLKVVNDDPSKDENSYNQALDWCQKKFKKLFTQDVSSKSDDDTNDEEYIKNTKLINRKSAIISAVYLVFKFQKVLRFLASLSYIIYPLFILCLLLEVLVGEESSYFIALFNINFISMQCFLCSCYKNYRIYQNNYSGKIIRRILKVLLISFIISILSGIMLFKIININGHLLLVYMVVIADILMLIDSNYLCKLILANENKKKIKIGKIILFGIILGIVILLITLVLSLTIEPIYSAILAYDEGLSNDLTLPITFWLIMFIVYVTTTLLLSILIIKKQLKKQSE